MNDNRCSQTRANFGGINRGGKYVPENEIVANLLLSNGGAHFLQIACMHGNVTP